MREGRDHATSCEDQPAASGPRDGAQSQRQAGLALVSVMERNRVLGEESVLVGPGQQITVIAAAVSRCRAQPPEGLNRGRGTIRRLESTTPPC